MNKAIYTNVDLRLKGEHVAKSLDRSRKARVNYTKYLRKYRNATHDAALILADIRQRYSKRGFEKWLKEHDIPTKQAYSAMNKRFEPAKRGRRPVKCDNLYYEGFTRGREFERELPADYEEREISKILAMFGKQKADNERLRERGYLGERLHALEPRLEASAADRDD